MPKRTDIKSIMIIRVGSMIIGQACELDRFRRFPGTTEMRCNESYRSLSKMT
jgi:hypothetical protein